MSLKKDLTIIFVSFYSKNIIEKPINQIDEEIPVIVVENSLDKDLKEKLENPSDEKVPSNKPNIFWLFVGSAITLLIGLVVYSI